MYSATTPEGILKLVSRSKVRNTDGYVQNNRGYFVIGKSVSLAGLYQLIKKKMTVAHRGKTWGK